MNLLQRIRRAFTEHEQYRPTDGDRNLKDRQEFLAREIERLKLQAQAEKRARDFYR